MVRPSCLEGLEILREHNLFVPKDEGLASSIQPGDGVLPEEPAASEEQASEEEQNTNQTSYWESEKIRFDASGSLVWLDLGGKRLYKGLPCEASVFLSFSKLQTLSLSGTDLPLSDILEVLSCLGKGSSQLKALYLGGNGLGPKGASQLAKSGVLEAFPNLQKLDLRYNDIKGSGTIDLCQRALRKIPSLKYLYLEGNGLADDGCNGLSLFLMKPEDQHLEELYLGQNEIGVDGAKALAKALETNRSLTKLYLEGNRLGPEGGIILCKVLEESFPSGHPTLKHLYVDNNQLTKEVSNRLAKALKSQTTIPDIGGP